MRLQILENGHGKLQKTIFKIMRFVSRIEVSGPIRIMSYRREFFGKYLAICFQEGMRESKEWTVGEVEIFAAFTAKMNECRF